jgi:hypothetical protein
MAERPTLRQPDSAPPPMYAHPAMERMHQQLLLYGGCWLQGGSRDVDCMRPEIIAVDPTAMIAGPGADDSLGKRVVLTNYVEQDFELRRDWTQPEIDAARALDRLVRVLPIQRRAVVQCFYTCEYAEIWPTLPDERRGKLVYELTHWPGQPRGVNARVDDHNDEYGDCVPHIVHELFLTVLHRAIRELIARLRGTVL